MIILELIRNNTGTNRQKQTDFSDHDTVLLPLVQGLLLSIIHFTMYLDILAKNLIASARKLRLGSVSGPVENVVWIEEGSP